MKQHRRMKIGIAAACALMAWAPVAQAQDLKILAGAGMAAPVRALADDYEARTLVHAQITVDTVSKIAGRLEAGEKYDLVIATTPVMDELADKNLIAPERALLARMVLGVATRQGAAVPVLRNAGDLKAALLAARSVAFVDPALGAVSSKFLLEQAGKMGIVDALAAKALIQKSGAGVPQAVARGDAELGVTLISEMVSTPGITLTPLPPDAQLNLIYAAAIAADPERGDAAFDFMAVLRRSEDRYKQAGLGPVQLSHRQ
jgi:molybdate transport system substrate-binding protein